MSKAASRLVLRARQSWGRQANGDRTQPSIARICISVLACAAGPPRAADYWSLSQGNGIALRTARVSCLSAGALTSRPRDMSWCRSNADTGNVPVAWEGSVSWACCIPGPWRSSWTG